MNDSSMDRTPGWKGVYTIVKRNEKSIWIRIGTAKAIARQNSVTPTDATVRVKLIVR